MTHHPETNDSKIEQGADDEARRATTSISRDRQTLLAALPLTEQRRELAGISTAVLEGGEGPPVILLHGPSANATHWMRVVPGLARTHRVIVPDLPGHGASHVASGSLDAERVLQWLGELIQQTCTARPALVGQLLGGAIAARFAIDKNVELARLVLIDTFGLSDFRPTPEFAHALTEFGAAPSEQTHRKLWGHCAYDLAILRAQMGAYWEPFEAYNIASARSASLKAALPGLMMSFGLHAIPAGDLARITVPTTLIWGRHDRATPLAIGESASTLYGWPLHVIDDVNDDPPVERPEAVTKALLSILSDGAAAKAPISSVARQARQP
jgi:pimeloyl-ACP methyl ester carboxylesterase